MSKGIVFLMILIILPAPVVGRYVHLRYDWEGDNANENFIRGVGESCYACHDGAMAGVNMPKKKCEDCHSVNEDLGRPNGPYSFFQIETNVDYRLREDYNAPLVFSHVSVSNPSSYSTCLNYDSETGEGACHGVSNEFGEDLGGYYAFNKTQDLTMSNDNPYSLSVSKESLPDSADCLFCHFQSNNQIVKMWGDPPQVVPILHAQFAGNGIEVFSKCSDCHLREGRELVNFHSEGIYVKGKDEKNDLPRNYPKNDSSENRGYKNKFILGITFLFLIGAILWLSRKFLSKKRKVRLKEKD